MILLVYPSFLLGVFTFQRMTGKETRHYTIHEFLFNVLYSVKLTQQSLAFQHRAVIIKLGINDWLFPAISLRIHTSLIGKTLILACLSLHKNWSFPLTISSVNVTKSAAFLRIWSHLLKKFLIETFIFLQCVSQRRIQEPIKHLWWNVL